VAKWRSAGPSISADGRFVAFYSQVRHFIAGRTCSGYEVYRWDRRTGLITLVSQAPRGRGGNDRSLYPTISADGARIAYESEASNLVPGDANGLMDIFVYDSPTATTTLITEAPGGEPANGYSTWPWISGDGAFVSFTSTATNLVAGDTNGVADIFRYDVAAGTTTLISRAEGGEQADDSSLQSSLSADGSRVGFSSDASNLVPDDGYAGTDLFVQDVSTGQTELITRGYDGGPANRESAEPRLSGDGARIAFGSSASNLVPNDLNGVQDIFLYDMSTHAISLVSRTPAGLPGAGTSYTAAISPDGGYVSFGTWATDLVPKTRWPGNLLLYTVATHTSELVTTGLEGHGANDFAASPSLSDHGGFIAFDSEATNLVQGVEGDNLKIFLYRHV
jgi:Tol biopolymer transport system component